MDIIEQSWTVKFSSRKAHVMKLSPYCSAKDAADVEQLLANCRNYAPEQSEIDNSQCLLEYFCDAFVASADGGQAYVIRDADGLVCSFVTVDQHVTRDNMGALYVTGLFVSKECDADLVVPKTIRLLQEYAAGGAYLFINVHPAHTKIVSYWQEHGYCHQPNASDFTNCDNERLLAYEKNNT